MTYHYDILIEFQPEFGQTQQVIRMEYIFSEPKDTVEIADWAMNDLQQQYDRIKSLSPGRFVGTTAVFVGYQQLAVWSEK